MKPFDELYDEIEQEVLINKPKNFFDDLNKEDKARPLVLYGAGGNCEFAMFTCSCVGISVNCICDRNPKGPYVYKDKSYDVISIEKLIKDYKNAWILITPWQYEQEIKKALLEKGIPENQTK